MLIMSHANELLYIVCTSSANQILIYRYNQIAKKQTLKYLPSLKKFWFETFNFNRFCISNRQSSTTIPEEKNNIKK